MTEMLSKLSVGAAQFGMHYGATNHKGQTPRDEVSRMLSAARSFGVSMLDTAPSYGESEAILGELRAVDRGFRVVTKVSPLPSGATRNALIQAEKTFLCSLQRLSTKRVYALLLHNCDDLFKPDSKLLHDWMQSMKSSGLVEKIGVSVYTKAQLMRALEKYSFDIVQAPSSILDQRLISDGTLFDLKQHGIEIHIRSVFLQGILLAEPESLPIELSPLSRNINFLREYASLSSVSLASLAVKFLLDIPYIDYVICGFENIFQFQEVSNDLQRVGRIPTELSDSVSVTSSELIDPSKWRFFSENK